MTLTELIADMGKDCIAVDNLRVDSLSPIEALKLGIEYRKMLALESISLVLSHIDVTLTDLNETIKWK